MKEKKLDRVTVVGTGFGGWIAAEDLCLDVFVYPDGRTLTLDEEEFLALDLSEQERRTARKAAQEIQEMARLRLPPFDEISSGTEKPG